TEANRFSRDLRNDASSSMTKTIPSGGTVSGIALSRFFSERQCQLKDCPAHRSWRRPHSPTLCFHDRPADRQTQARAIGLGGEERVEHPLRVVGLDPCPCVPHLHNNLLTEMPMSDAAVARLGGTR